jgi:hypothetical protein
LSPEDHKDLEWFFGEAPARFDRSTSGGIFDHIANSSPSAIREMGLEYGRPRALPVLNAAGDVIGRIEARDAVTARVTHESRTPSGFEPQDHDRRRFARISRLVQSLAATEHGSTHVAVLRAYFGDAGNQWAHLAVQSGPYEMVDKTVDGKPVRVAQKKTGNPCAAHASHGRIGALYALTRGGGLLLRYLAELARKKGQPDLGFTEDLRMQLEVSTPKVSDERKALLSRASSEARALVTVATLAWNDVRDQAVRDHVRDRPVVDTEKVANEHSMPVGRVRRILAEAGYGR